MEGVDGIIEQIEMMKEEKEMPKNIKAKLQQVIEILKTEGQETSLKIDRALSELEEVSDDVNIPSDVRMDLFNLSSLLENIRS
jgi:uncharacterized protein (UPF0147 family)